MPPAADQRDSSRGTSDHSGVYSAHAASASCADSWPAGLSWRRRCRCGLAGGSSSSSSPTSRSSDGSAKGGGGGAAPPRIDPPSARARERKRATKSRTKKGLQQTEAAQRAQSASVARRLAS
eukprot:366024-Chlamydomonas_euryale.AAC.13